MSQITSPILYFALKNLFEGKSYMFNVSATHLEMDYKIIFYYIESKLTDLKCFIFALEKQKQKEIQRYWRYLTFLLFFFDFSSGLLPFRAIDKSTFYTLWHICGHQVWTSSSVTPQNTLIHPQNGSF
ncbi:hypothetical protein ACJX0J_033501 [Zea mays]